MEGELYEADDLDGKIYVICCACMSIYSEFLSWANKYPDRMTNDPFRAKNIIILSCQVTDLAILNDLNTLESLNRLFKDDPKDYYIGGCLARRFDIEFEARRLDNIKEDYQQIENRNLIDYAAPFWVDNFNEDMEDFDDGMLFRKMYPLRVSAGCHKKCAYCSIRIVRGKNYNLNVDKLRSEFLSHEDVVAIADSLIAEQVKELITLAAENNKSISFRNLDPDVAFKCRKGLNKLAHEKLLKILHVPIQSDNVDTLIDMGRNSSSVGEFMTLLPYLKSMDVFLATNIIIDYKHFSNPDMVKLRKYFNYISWNPYWDGKWNRDKAIERNNKYSDYKEE